MPRSPARLQPKRSAASMADCVKGLPSEHQLGLQVSMRLERGFEPRREWDLAFPPTLRRTNDASPRRTPNSQRSGNQIHVAPLQSDELALS